MTRDPGSSDALLEALLAPPRAPAPGELIGIEHEYVVRNGAAAVDFHELIHQLPVPGRRLDPGDCNAYRLPSGLALTADEGEAEVATPPIAVTPGFANDVAAWAQHGRSQLEQILPPAHELEGYSTHLSAAMPGVDGDEVARVYARTFAPALALLLERPGSQGLYVRPRPGRLELCGEFVAGARLGAVAAFVAGTSRATALAVAGSGTLPAALAVQTLPAVERYGLRVTRHACGLDLYAAGRAALLPLAAGGEIPAQLYLESAWNVARAALQRAASSADLAALDRIVAGALPLGVEIHDPEAPPSPSRSFPSSPLGQVTRRWRRPGFLLEAVVATWDFTVFRAEGDRTSALVCIPRESLAEFVAKVDAGLLDGALRGALEGASTRPILSGNEQTERVGVFSGLADPVDLLPTEREPDSGAAKSPRGGRAGKTGGSPAGGRPGKSGSRPWKLAIPMRPPRSVAVPAPGPGLAPNSEAAPLPLPLPPAQGVPPPQPPAVTEPPPPPVNPVSPTGGGGGVPWLVVAAVAVVGLLGAVVVGAIAVNGGGSDPTPTPTTAATVTKTAEPTKSPTATATAATATSTPKVDAAAASPTSTLTPSQTATKTPDGGVLPATTTPTSVTNPTETAIPTATPAKFATETPRPTSTSTRTPTPTNTPTRTPTPTPTPTRVIDVPVPTVAASCTPSGGVACPTPSP